MYIFVLGIYISLLLGIIAALEGHSKALIIFLIATGCFLLLATQGGLNVRL